MISIINMDGPLYFDKLV